MRIWFTAGIKKTTEVGSVALLNWLLSRINQTALEFYETNTDFFLRINDEIYQ
jgi:hypothetical protein